MQVSRFTVGLCGVIVLSLAVLVGVGTAQSTARKGQPTLTIATVNNPDMIVMQALSSKFTSKYGIKVKYVTLPENTLRQKVTSDVATGGGQFDIATVGTYDVPIWAKNKWLVSLQPYFGKLSSAAAQSYDLNDVLPKVRLGLSYNNSLYAVPFYGESSMTYYNKKLFAGAGLKMPLHPTWDQIQSFAAKLNKSSSNQYGICLRALPGWGEFGAPLTTVINTFGGQWFNTKWEPQLTSGPFEAAVNFYVNLIRKYGEPGATSSGFTECETAMAQGKTAMWVDATVAAGQLTDPSKSQVAKDIGFAYAPTKVTPLGSHWLWAWSLAIEASSKNKDAAFKFLTSQDLVNKTVLGAIGGSCGVNQAIQAARRHPEIKTLVLLSGGTDADGETFIKNAAKMPIFGAASEEDTGAAASIKKIACSCSCPTESSSP